ncbi:hypothetical protein Y032_0197g1579 [Ancylostoma ceylanicum]|uniref:Uncharacterized protein n=1 Tax=Ancylostoma ceylanicum TaxID=53326 RepID=A0A016SP95_9BILA|nr:hypothetical protein Y032_0197g1579 [Ancylostoma ceylanicum]
MSKWRALDSPFVVQMSRSPSIARITTATAMEQQMYHTCGDYGHDENCNIEALQPLTDVSRNKYSNNHLPATVSKNQSQRNQPCKQE